MLNTIDRLRQRRDDELEGQCGFTLIETLIVIVILGVLAGIVVFAFQDVVGSTAQAACKSDFKTVETAVEAFNARTGHYPTNQTDAGTPGVVNNTPPGTPYTLPTGFTPPTGTTDLVGALMTQQGANGGGPWVRDFPGNGSHYQIVVAANATSGQPSVIDVYKVDGTGSVAGAGATHTVADCGSVS